MTSAWDDFENSDRDKPPNIKSKALEEDENDDTKACDWGFARPDCDPDAAQASLECSRFIELYEQYLNDKRSCLSHKTKNHHLYATNPSKALRDWFENEGHEYSQTLKDTCNSQYKCIIDLPVGDQDFTFESEAHPKKQMAIDEVSLAACKLLDDSELFKSWHQEHGTKDPDRKRRIDEANKEDDIELDDSKPTGLTGPKPKKNTLESLKSRWSQLNMTILGLKAKLVKMELGVSKRQEADKATSDDEDPLDAFMSNLDKKTGLTLDEKIEKSRIKTEISAHQREQEEISEMIEEINT